MNINPHQPLSTLINVSSTLQKPPCPGPPIQYQLNEIHAPGQMGDVQPGSIRGIHLLPDQHFSVSVADTDLYVAFLVSCRKLDKIISRVWGDQEWLSRLG
jgi:hypothetical protein